MSSHRPTTASAVTIANVRSNAGVLRAFVRSSCLASRRSKNCLMSPASRNCVISANMVWLPPVELVRSLTQIRPRVVRRGSDSQRRPVVVPAVTAGCTYYDDRLAQNGREPAGGAVSDRGRIGDPATDGCQERFQDVR